MASIQEFLFLELNSEKEMKIQDKEKKKKGLIHSVYLIYAIMPIIYILGKILSHLSFMVKSYSSNLLLMYRQIINRKNSIRLYVNLQQDQRTYNLSTAKEIAVIIPKEGVHHVMNNRDIVL